MPLALCYLCHEGTPHCTFQPHAHPKIWDRAHTGEQALCCPMSWSPVLVFLVCRSMGPGEVTPARYVDTGQATGRGSNIMLSQCGEDPISQGLSTPKAPRLSPARTKKPWQERLCALARRRMCTFGAIGTQTHASFLSWKPNRRVQDGTPSPCTGLLGLGSQRLQPAPCVPRSGHPHTAGEGGWIVV